MTLYTKKVLSHFPESSLLVALSYLGYFVLTTPDLVIIVLLAMIIFSLTYPGVSIKLESRLAFALHLYAVSIGLWVSIMFCQSLKDPYGK